ncbi:type II toxin-antitoxin system HipA family toxin, partial [Salmonella enterica subsp. enterica serovar Typhimurium]|uniref:HipA domain-containing protein n=2 Tax=Bacteria TaxID=2 RepID=UPI0015C7AA39
ALWMAKFARDTEYSDPMAWEATALALARQSGVETPAFELERIAEGRSILLTKRFDRVGEQRIGYLSAHSLTTKPE